MALLWLLSEELQLRKRASDTSGASGVGNRHGETGSGMLCTKFVDQNDADLKEVVRLCSSRMSNSKYEVPCKSCGDSDNGCPATSP